MLNGSGHATNFTNTYVMCYALHTPAIHPHTPPMAHTAMRTKHHSTTAPENQPRPLSRYSPQPAAAATAADAADAAADAAEDEEEEEDEDEEETPVRRLTS